METLSLDREAVMALVPHRPPFLLLDGVVDYVVGERITGVRRVAADDPVFAGHFPGSPVYPGVLIIEALAQLTVALLKLDPAHAERLFLFGGVNKMRFFRPVPPGCTLRLESRLTRRLPTAAVAEVSAWLGEEAVAKGELITGSGGQA